MDVTLLKKHKFNEKQSCKKTNKNELQFLWVVFNKLQYLLPFFFGDSIFTVIK